MKRILFLLALLPTVIYGQSVLPLRADTIRIEKSGGSAELQLRNATKDSLGLLTNIGNGRTRFLVPHLRGDTLFVGKDTIIGARKIDSLFRKPGIVDSIYFKISGLEYSLFTGIYNALGSGDVLVNGDQEVKTIAVGFGLFRSVTGTTVTHRADTTRGTGLPTYPYVDSLFAVGGSTDLDEFNVGFGNSLDKLGTGTTNFTYRPGHHTLVLNKEDDDSAAIDITHSYTGEKPFLRVHPPVKSDSTLDFTMTSVLNPNDDGTRSNHVVKWGFNIFNGKPLFPSIWYAMESGWVSGGTNYQEAHLETRFPNGEQARLYSSTLVRRDSLGNSSNQWDFRGNINFSTLNNHGYGAIAPDNEDGVMLQIIAPDNSLGAKVAVSSGTANKLYFDRIGDDAGDIDFRGWSNYNFGTGADAIHLTGGGNKIGIGTDAPEGQLHIKNNGSGASTLVLEALDATSGSQIRFLNESHQSFYIIHGNTSLVDQNLKNKISFYDGVLGNPIFAIDRVTGNSVFGRFSQLSVIDDPRLLAVMGTMYVGDTMHLHTPPDGGPLDSVLVLHQADSSVRKMGVTGLLEADGWYTVKGTISGAGPTIITPATPSGTAVILNVTAAAEINDGSKGYTGVIVRGFHKDAGGTCTGGTVDTQINDQFGTTFSVTLIVSGNNPSISVNGVVGEDYAYTIRYRYTPAYYTP